MDEKIDASVMFLKTAKEIWNTFKMMYSDKHNISGAGFLSILVLDLKVFQ